MNGYRDGLLSHRRVQNSSISTDSVDTSSPNHQNETISNSSGVAPDITVHAREEMLYQLSDETVHWQFPRIIVGYQPMRPYPSGVHGLMLQPTMVYQADNMIYHLRNEDLTKPSVPQQSSPDIKAEEKNNLSKVQNYISNRNAQENDVDQLNAFKGIFDLKVQKPSQNLNLSSDCIKTDRVNKKVEHSAPNGQQQKDAAAEEELVKPQLKMLVVKTVASQTNITLQSPDSLSVKKSYDSNNSAKSNSDDAQSNGSTQLPAKQVSETVI